MDIHTWIETNDGSIIDPHFPCYDNICVLQNCDNSVTYYLSDPSKLGEIAMFLKDYIDNVLPKKHTNHTSQEILLEYYNNPKPFECHMNTYAYKYFNKHCKICVG